jgi:L-fuconolactonase
MAAPGSEDWLKLVEEDIVDPDRVIVDPDRVIVDPHHHLWNTDRLQGPYLLEQLRADTRSGHNVVQTVFVECRATARVDDPDSLRPVGETEFVAEIAQQAMTAKARLSRRLSGTPTSLWAIN